MPIRNIVFDVGNVLVPWDPAGIEARALGVERVSATGFVPPFRGNATWLAVNRGELTLTEAKRHYIAHDGLTADDVDKLYEALFDSFPIKADTLALMHELRCAQYRLFAITDNVHEVVAHLKESHDFWALFETAAVSAEIGVLKPDPRIYRWLLDTARIEASECVFLDDVERNVDGAKAVGMEAFVFTDAPMARRDLRSVGVEIAHAP